MEMGAQTQGAWHHFSLAYLLLLLEGLLLVLRCRFRLVSVLFGPTFQELVGKVLGVGSVPQVGPDIVVHLVRRVHLFQEGCKRRNCRADGWRRFVSSWRCTAFAKHVYEQVSPSRLLAVLRVCRVCSHHCMKVSCLPLLTPWNSFSSFSSSSAFLLARPLPELLCKKYRSKTKRRCVCVLLTSYIFFRRL